MNHFYKVFLAASSIFIISTAHAERKDDVRKVIHDHIFEFRICYMDTLAKNPDLKGKVVIDFEVNDKGETTKVSAAPNSKIDNKKLLDCMYAHFKALKFPAAPAGQVMSIRYPFVFNNKR